MQSAPHRRLPAFKPLHLALFNFLLYGYGLERIEWHYTPKHGIWLNMAEIEIGVAQHQCLDRRIGDQATLQSELEAWSQKRTAAHCRTDWQFTTEDARIKRLSPSTLLN